MHKAIRFRIYNGGFSQYKSNIKRDSSISRQHHSVLMPCIRIGPDAGSPDTGNSKFLTRKLCLVAIFMLTERSASNLAS